MTHSHRIKLIATVVCISTAAPLFIQLEHLPASFVASLRLIIASIVLLLLGGWRWFHLTNEELKSAIVCGSLYALHFGAWVTSLRYTSTAASVTLVTTTPLLLWIWALWRGQKPSKEQLRLQILAITGVLILVGTDWQVSVRALHGDLLALIGALAMAMYFLRVKSMGSFPLQVFLSLTTLTGGLTLWLFTCLNHDDPLSLVSNHDWLWLLLLALVPHVIGHTLLTWALRSQQPSEVALLTVGEPAGSTFLCYILFGETISLTAMCGCGLTLFAIGRSINTKASS